MFKIFNRKLNFHNTNISNRKYHRYFEEYKYFSKRTQRMLKQFQYEVKYGRGIDINLYEALFVSFENTVLNEKAYTLLRKLDENQEILKSDYDDEILKYIEIDKRFKFEYVTPGVYAKFDKFKQIYE